MTKNVFCFTFGLLLGCVIAITVTSAAVLAARAFWAGYAAAQPGKYYTLAMFFARLAAEALSAAFAVCGATVLAGDY